MDSRMKLFEERKLNYKLKFIFGVKFFIKISHLNFTFKHLFQKYEICGVIYAKLFQLEAFGFLYYFYKDILCQRLYRYGVTNNKYV